MFNLFKIEFLKFRNRALIGSIIHMGLMAFTMVITVNLNATPYYNLWLLGCVGTAGLFGIMQMSAHKRQNHWVYLIQRPLAPWKIGTALITAGGLHILIALVLPFFVYQWLRSLNPDAFVEARNYLQFMQIIGIVLAMYIYAAFSALYPHGLRYLVFLLAVVVAMNFPGVHLHWYISGVFLLATFCFYSWFKPELEAGPDKTRFIILSELPIHFGLFWLLLMFLGLISQVSWNVFKTGPYWDNNGDTIASLRSYTADKEVMLAALEDMPAEEALFYRQQIRLGEIYQAGIPLPGEYPVRNQRPSLDRNLELAEPDTTHVWHFQHSEMLFKGVDGNTSEVVGWLGPQGFLAEVNAETARFDSVPWTVRNDYILDRAHIWQLDWEAGQLMEKYNLAWLPGYDGQEYFTNSVGFAENFATLFSSRNFYIFRTRALQDSDAILEAEIRLPLPYPEHIRAMQTQVLELIDGYLVSMVPGSYLNELEGEFDSYDLAGLYLWHTGKGRENVLVNSRLLPSGFGMFRIYEGFMLAPGFRLINDVVSGLVANNPKEETWSFVYHRFPLPVLAIALLSMLVSGFGVAKLMQNVAVSRKVRIAWIAVAAFSGVLGLACFWFGIYRCALVMQKKPESRPAVEAEVLEFAHA